MFPPFPSVFPWILLVVASQQSAHPRRSRLLFLPLKSPILEPLCHFWGSVLAVVEENSHLPRPGSSRYPLWPMAPSAVLLASHILPFHRFQWAKRKLVTLKVVAHKFLLPLLALAENQSPLLGYYISFPTYTTPSSEQATFLSYGHFPQ